MLVAILVELVTAKKISRSWRSYDEGGRCDGWAERLTREVFKFLLCEVLDRNYRANIVLLVLLGLQDDLPLQHLNEF